MSTRTVSTQQAAQQLDATHFLQVATGPVTLYGFEGYVNGNAGTQYYLQIHGVAPTTGSTVPLYSVQVIGGNGFSFLYNNGLNTKQMSFPDQATTGGTNTLPVFFAISSTDTVYTSVAASTDLLVTLDEPRTIPANETITGDTTTGRDSLPVYTSPNTAKRLMKFQVTNNTGATAYLMLFAYSNPALGDVPQAQWTIANGATLTQDLGTGLMVMQAPAFVLKTGCYLFGSSTTQTLTATVATNWKMKAWNI
jgi:hypothetical protein